MRASHSGHAPLWHLAPVARLLQRTLCLSYNSSSAKQLQRTKPSDNLNTYICSVLPGKSPRPIYTGTSSCWAQALGKPAALDCVHFYPWYCGSQAARLQPKCGVTSLACTASTRFYWCIDMLSLLTNASQSSSSHLCSRSPVTF